MNDTIYIAYNKRSSVTAKNLKEKLNAEGIETRLINRKRFLKKPSVLIRIGNSYKEAPDGCVEINKIDAVRNASNKLIMAKILSNTEGVRFPRRFAPHSSIEILDSIFGTSENRHGFEEVTSEAELYCRNNAGIVRRRRMLPTDLYATEPIQRAREFRVHVFNGRTIGVYEKVPVNQDGEMVSHQDTVYCKAENCDFVRIDTSNKEARSSIIGIRPMAVLATTAMGLDFAGVDVIIAEDGSIFVNEVNSAPSLNSLNIDRYCEKIIEIINGGQRNSEEGN